MSDLHELHDELRRLRRHTWVNTVLLLTLLSSFVVGPSGAISLIIMAGGGIAVLLVGSGVLHWFGSRLAEEDRRRRESGPESGSGE